MFISLVHKQALSGVAQENNLIYFCSIRIFIHSSSAGIVNFSTQKHSIMCHLAFGKKFSSGIVILAFRNNIPRRSHSLVQHPGESHISAIIKSLVNLFFQIQSNKFVPAILIKSHDKAFILNTGYGREVSMLAGEHFIITISRLTTNVRVFRSIEPQQRHHHLTCKQNRNFYDISHGRKNTHCYSIGNLNGLWPYHFRCIFSHFQIHLDLIINFNLPSSGFSQSEVTFAIKGRSFFLLPDASRIQSLTETSSSPSS